MRARARRVGARRVALARAAIAMTMMASAAAVDAPPYPPYPEYPEAPPAPAPPRPPRPPPAPRAPHPPRSPPSPPPPTIARTADGAALVIFTALTLIVVSGLVYVGIGLGGARALGERRRGASGRNARGARQLDDSDSEEEMTLRDELREFAKQAKVIVAEGARAAIVRVQRLTHGESGERDEDWRRLSDTNPFVRWVKRQLADDDNVDDGVGEPLIDERDDDYEDLMAEPYRFSEFADYVDAVDASSLDAVEDAAFVRLPRAQPEPSWFARSPTTNTTDGTP